MNSIPFSVCTRCYSHIASRMCNIYALDQAALTCSVRFLYQSIALVLCCCILLQHVVIIIIIVEVL